MADIGALIIRIGAEAGGVKKTLDDLTGSTRQFQRGMESLAATVSGAFFAAASAAVGMTIQAGRTAEEIEKTAEKTGIAAGVIEGMTVAMNRNGLSTQSIVAAMRTLSKEMVGIKSLTESSVKLFGDMNISLETVKKGTNATLRAIADRFKDMPNGAEKARLAVDLFGRSGLDLIPILNKGSAGFDEAMRKSVEFGLVLRETERNSLSTFDDAVDDMNSALKGFSTQVGVAFAPALTALVKHFTEAIVFAKDIFNGFADAAEKLTIRAGAMVAAISAIARQMFSMSVLSKDAWKQTLEEVKAIDQWAASQLKAVDATRLFGQAQADFNSQAVKVIANQKTLGQQAVSYTQIQNKLRDELSKTIFVQADEEERVRLLNEQLSKPPTTGAFVEAIERKEAAVKNLLNIMPELTRDEAIALASKNYEYATAQLSLNTEAWHNRNNALVIAADYMKVVDSQQQMFYQGEANMIGASEAARRVRMATIEAEGALQRKVIEEEVANEEMRNAKLRNLSIEMETQRMQAIRQFPTVFEKQLNDIVQSNSFSVSQIVTSWTSGFANAIVNAESFGQAMAQIGKQTAVSLLQSLLNFGVQELAQFALQQSRKLALGEAFQAALTAGTAAGEAGRVGVVMASNKLQRASVFASIAAIGSVGQAAITAAGVVTGLVAAMFESIAAALDATIVGLELGAAFHAAGAVTAAAGATATAAATGALQGALGTAIAAASASFGGGGIVTGPTLSMIGEAGSSEAVIPLNDRGAAFMRDALGASGSGGPTTIVVELDGEPILKHVRENLPSVLRLRGLPA